jgi:hypothetical protein
MGNNLRVSARAASLHSVKLTDRVSAHGILVATD